MSDAFHALTKPVFYIIFTGTNSRRGKAAVVRGIRELVIFNAGAAKPSRRSDLDCKKMRVRSVFYKPYPRFLFDILQGGKAFLAGADLDDVLHIVNEDLAVADMTGIQRLFRRFDDRSHRHLADYDLNLYLRQ